MKKLAFALALLVHFVSALSIVRGQFEAERVFPPATQMFFSVPNTELLNDKWGATELGSFFAQPEFEPFRESLSNQLEQVWRARFGISINDVTAISSGEIGGGLIATTGRKPGFVLLVDITGKEVEVTDFLVKTIKQATNVRNGSAKKDRFQIGNTSLDATVVTVPPDENFPEGLSTWYVDLKKILVIADSRYLTELMLQQLGGLGQGSLATQSAYRETMKACLADIPTGETPQIRFFVNPLEAGAALEALSPASEKKDKNQPSLYVILANQGFDGAKGVGGTVNLASAGFESITRFKVYIPEPPKKAFNMLKFQNVSEIALPGWVSNDVDRCIRFSVDPNNIFNHVGPLFDEFLESEGAWDDILISLEKEENGPRVSLKNDLIAHLGTELTVIRTFVAPLQEGSGRFIATLDVKPGSQARLQTVLGRMFDTDPDFRKVAFESEVIWQYIRPPKGTVRPTPTRSARSGRTARPARPVAAPIAVPESNEPPMITGGAFCVSNGYFWLSNDIDFLRAHLLRLSKGELVSLAKLSQYQKVEKIILEETKTTGLFTQGFVFGRKETELNYDLLRRGKLQGSTTLLGRFLGLLDPRKELPPIDGTALPPFSEVKEMVGPGGYYGRVEPDGWFFKRFGLPAEKSSTTTGLPAL